MSNPLKTLQIKNLKEFFYQNKFSFLEEFFKLFLNTYQFLKLKKKKIFYFFKINT